MWNMKYFVIPVIIGATGIVTKGLKKYLETIPGKHSTGFLQRTVVLGTSHIAVKPLFNEPLGDWFSYTKLRFSLNGDYVKLHQKHFFYSYTY
jgi:hypothetical protein